MPPKKGNKNAVKANDEKRSKRVVVRVTEAEDADLKKRAGEGTVADYVRAELFGG